MKKTMAIFEHGDVKIDVDEDGFMLEPDQWNEEVALALAEPLGELGEERVDVVAAPLPVLADPAVRVLLRIGAELPQHFVGWRPVTGEHDVGQTVGA